jgi:hypothetical protein
MTSWMLHHQQNCYHSEETRIRSDRAFHTEHRDVIGYVLHHTVVGCPIRTKPDVKEASWIKTMVSPTWWWTPQTISVYRGGRDVTLHNYRIPWRIYRTSLPRHSVSSSLTWALASSLGVPLPIPQRPGIPTPQRSITQPPCSESRTTSRNWQKSSNSPQHQRPRKGKGQLDRSD